MTIDKIKEVLADHLDEDMSAVTEDTSFEELGIDSLETVEILMELEDEFGIEIPAASAGKTVGSLVEFIDSEKE